MPCVTSPRVRRRKHFWEQNLGAGRIHFARACKSPPGRSAVSRHGVQKETTDFCRNLSFLFGDPAGIRTPDPLLKRQLLCRLSYRVIWLGWLDSNQRMRESKSRALPLGDTPILSFQWEKKQGTGMISQSLAFLGWVMGLEPTTPGTTIRCSNQLSYTHQIHGILQREINWHARRDSNPWPTA